MKALVKKEATKGIWMEDVPMPKVGVNDVLIKIKKTAICGTDLHIYKWDEWSQKTIKTPMTIGHEYVGCWSCYGVSWMIPNYSLMKSCYDHLTPNC